MTGPFFSETTAAGAAYLSMLQEETELSIKNLFLEEKCYFQQYGAPSHYHSDTRNFLSVQQSKRHVHLSTFLMLL
jgi:hypothetical protein